MATTTSATLDRSLDDIISSKKGVRRPPRRRTGAGAGARAAVLGTPTVGPATRARAAAAATTSNPADKIIVSNLPADVNEVQIKELFHSTVGALKDVTLHYDSAGRSKGVASVHFQRKGDGTKAYQQYNNRLIDGKRPMKIEIVVDPTKSAPSLVSRVAPATVAAAGGSTARRGRRGGRVGGRPKKTERPAKSAADLDAEMEDYTAHNAPAATA